MCIIQQSNKTFIAVQTDFSLIHTIKNTSVSIKDHIYSGATSDNFTGHKAA